MMRVLTTRKWLLGVDSTFAFDESVVLASVVSYDAER